MVTAFSPRIRIQKARFLSIQSLLEFIIRGQNFRGGSSGVIERILELGLGALFIAGMLYLGWHALLIGKHWQQRVWGEKGDQPPSIVSKDPKDSRPPT
jgi:hypothetical protein